MTRPDGRKADELRPVTIETGYLQHAEGSALISCGDTKVLCAASVEDSIPSFRKGSGEGWLSAEYSLMPRSTNVRTNRERGKVGGRTYEIQRTIGRVLRASIDFTVLGERTIWLDCDVIQADGGTRTASMTGAWVALSMACNKLLKDGYISKSPIINQIAAVSVGIYEATPVLDLNYREDFAAAVDMNIAMTDSGGFVEIQGTAEEKPFSESQFAELLALAKSGIISLQKAQQEAISI